MKTFVLKVVFFVCIISIVIVLCGNRISGIHRSNFMSAIINKHKRLDSLNGKRIIFAGGSNLSLGLNSRFVEAEMNLPVVNLGLHAALGLDFILNEVKSVIKDGDVVFLSIEYYLGKGDYDLQMNTAEYFPDAEKYIPVTPISEKIKYYTDKKIKNVSDNAKYYASKLKRNVSDTNEVVYDKKYFNVYGDDTAVFNIETTTALANRVLMEYGSWDGIEKINALNAYAKLKNVKIFFLYPQYPESEYKTNFAVIKRYQADLAQNLKTKILNTPEYFILPDDFFFDTVYHLNGKGVVERTRRLIALLQKNKELINASN